MPQGRQARSCPPTVLGARGDWGKGLVFCQTGTPALPGETWRGARPSRECKTHSIRLLPPPSSYLLCSGQPRSPERQGSGCGEQVRRDGHPPWPAPPLPCSPPPQPCTPSPTASPAWLSPRSGAWLGCQGHAGARLGCQGHAGALVPPQPQCSSPAPAPPATLGAPSIAPRALHPLSHPRLPGSGVPLSEQGATQPSPKSIWSLPHPTSLFPPHPPQSSQHSGTFPLAPALRLGEHWPQALGARGEAGNRQQLPWWQSTVSPLTLQTLGEDTFIALPRPVTHKFFGAGERGMRGAGTVVPGV